MAVQKPNIVRVQIPGTSYGKGRATRISQISEHHAVGDAKHVISKAQTAQFSTTFTIALDGTIYQLVELHDTPYCDNDYRSNGRSITIEHAGGGNFPYTEAMYQSSIRLHAWLFQTYGELNCVRHRDIPEIKADPRKATACSGNLDVDRIVREAKQLLRNGDEMPIPNDDNHYARWRQLGWFIRGRELSRQEFINAAVGRTWLNAMEILADNEEANAAQHAQSIGQVAVRDKWDQQIYGLQDQLKKAQEQIAELAKNPTKQKYDEIQTNLQACEVKANEMATKITKPDAPAILKPAVGKVGLLTRLIALFLNRKKK